MGTKVSAAVLGLLNAGSAAVTTCRCGALGYSRAGVKEEGEPGVDKKFAGIDANL